MNKIQIKKCYPYGDKSLYRKILWLPNDKITDISFLKNLISLEKLSFFCKQISDISPLKNLVNLKQLCLFDHPSQQQFDELKKYLPNCKIQY